MNDAVDDCLARLSAARHALEQSAKGFKAARETLARANADLILTTNNLNNSSHRSIAKFYA